MRRAALVIAGMLALGACQSPDPSASSPDGQADEPRSAASDPPATAHHEPPYEDCRALAEYLGHGGFSHDDTYDPESDVLRVYGVDGRRFRIAPGDTGCITRSAAVAERVRDAVQTYESSLGEDSGSKLLRAATQSSTPDARYDGVPVWWAPPVQAEPQLEWLDSAIPRSIDLGVRQPVLQPGEPAQGVFVVMDAHAGPLRFIVLTVGGDTRELPAEHIEGNRDQDGNTAALMPANGGLSPDGRHLAIAQRSTLELYDLVSGDWTTIDTADWVAEGARWLDETTIWVPDQLEEGSSGSAYGVDGDVVDSSVARVEHDLAVTPDDQPYGGWVDAPSALAGSYFLAGPVRGGRYTNPEGLIARIGGTTVVLAIDIAGRNKACCPVVGWLSADTVAFESGGRVLAWQPDSGVVHRVAEFTGLDTGEETKSSSWAWRALS